MMIRLTWEEFTQLAYEKVREKFPDLTLNPPQFKKNHGSYDGGIGEAYDIPDFVDFEVSP